MTTIMSVVSVVPKNGRGIQRYSFRLAVGLAIVLSLAAGRVPAQKGPVKVSYDVEFSTTGQMVARDGQCSSGAGYDVLTGTISGVEPPQPGDDYVYQGLLTRNTKISFCYTATAPNGNSRACTLEIEGRAEAWFELAVEPDARGGYLKLMDDKPVKVFKSSVGGTCDITENNEMNRDYKTMTTGGSPNGQPINVNAMPRIGPFPKIFEPLDRRKAPSQSPSAGPSLGEEGIWKLTVKGWH